MPSITAKFANSRLENPRRATPAPRPATQTPYSEMRTRAALVCETLTVRHELAQAKELIGMLQAAVWVLVAAIVVLGGALWVRL